MTARNANENSVCRDSFLSVSDFFSLLNLLPTTPPVSVPDVSKAKGLPQRCEVLASC